MLSVEGTSLYDGDGIPQTVLPPGVASPALRAPSVTGQMPNRLCYPALTGHTWTVDLLVPDGSRPHIGHPCELSQK